MPRKRIRHRLMEPLDRGEVGRQVRIPLRHPHAEQGQRGEQAARGRVGDPQRRCGAVGGEKDGQRGAEGDRQQQQRRKPDLVPEENLRELRHQPRL